MSVHKRLKLEFDRLCARGQAVSRKSHRGKSLRPLQVTCPALRRHILQRSGRIPQRAMPFALFLLTPTRGPSRLRPAGVCQCGPTATGGVRCAAVRGEKPSGKGPLRLGRLQTNRPWRTKLSPAQNMAEPARRFLQSLRALIRDPVTRDDNQGNRCNDKHPVTDFAW